MEICSGTTRRATVVLGGATGARRSWACRLDTVPSKCHVEAGNSREHSIDGRCVAVTESASSGSSLRSASSWSCPGSGTPQMLRSASDPLASLVPIESGLAAVAPASGGGPPSPAPAASARRTRSRNSDRSVLGFRPHGRSAAAWRRTGRCRAPTGDVLLVGSRCTAPGRTLAS